MKKVLAVVVTLAMVLSMFAIVSNANGFTCFDGAFFTTNPAPGTHVPTAEEKDVKSEAAGDGNLGSVYDLGYTYLHLQGWYGDADDYSDLGYSINGGETVWGCGIYDANLWDENGNSRTGFPYNYRFNLNLALQEGDVTITMIAKMADGSDKEFKTLSYTNKAPDPNVKTYSNKVIGGGDNNIGVWIQGSNNYATIKFTTAGGFKGFGVPIYWASNRSVGNGPYGKYTIELFKFDTNTEKTLAGTPVKSFNVDGNGDNNPAFSFTFDDALEAGTYIAKFTLANADESEELQAANEDAPKAKSPYLVLPKMNAGNPDESKFEFNVDPFNFFVIGEDGIDDFYAVNPEDGEAPAATSIIDESKYDVSYKINKDNATNWANGNINGIDVTYFFKVEDDGLAVAVRGIGLKDGEYVQLNFNPGNYLWEVPGQFISVVLGENLKVMQHNHKNGLLADDNPGGADITDKVANQVQKTADGYEVVFKLPKALFTITDVEGADAFVYGEDDLYFGMFLVAGGGGLSNQKNTDYTDWTCRGLNLNEYVLETARQPETVPQTGDMTVAMFAVIAVLAMGAAVVFMKKRAF